MGMLMNLLCFPVTLPAKGLVFVLETIKDRVDAEELDEGLVEDQLTTLSLLHDLGEVEDGDYIAQEEALMERMNAIRAYKESLARVEARGEEDQDD